MPTLFIPPCTDPEDYIGQTFEEAVANPVQEGLTHSLLEACTDITIVDDMLDGEGSEQLQLMLEFSHDNTNINVEGCPANVTIWDRRKYMDFLLATYYIYISFKLIIY